MDSRKKKTQVAPVLPVSSDEHNTNTSSRPSRIFRRVPRASPPVPAPPVPGSRMSVASSTASRIPTVSRVPQALHPTQETVCDSNATFQDLPPDAILEIAKRMPRSDQANLGKTCRTARAVINTKLDAEKPYVLNIKSHPRYGVDTFSMQFLRNGRLSILQPYVIKDPTNIARATHFNIAKNKTEGTLSLEGGVVAVSQNKLFLVTTVWKSKDPPENTKTFKVYDIENLKLVKEFTLPYFVNGWRQLYVSDNGTIAFIRFIPNAGVEVNGYTQIYDRYHLGQYKCMIVHPYQQKMVEIEMEASKNFTEDSIAFTPDGKYMVATIGDLFDYGFYDTVNQVTCVWDTTSGARVSTLNDPCPHCILSPDGVSLYSYGNIYNILTGQVIHTIGQLSQGILLLANGDKCKLFYPEISAYFSPDGRHLYIVIEIIGKGPHICMYDLMKSRYTMHKAFQADLLNYPFSLDGKYFFAATTSRTSSKIRGAWISLDGSPTIEVVGEHDLLGSAMNDEYIVTVERTKPQVYKAWPLKKERPAIPPISGSPRPQAETRGGKTRQTASAVGNRKKKAL